MLAISPSYLHIDHIAWQPIFNCKPACKGCYIANYCKGKKNEDGLWGLWPLFSNKKISCNQFTFAASKIPPVSRSYIQEVVKILQETNRIKSRCITFKNLTSLENWQEYIKLDHENWTFNFWDWATMISFSELPKTDTELETLRLTARNTNTIINFNTMGQQKHLTALASHVDMVYGVLKKPALGHKCSIKDKQQFKYMCDTLRVHPYFVQDLCVQASKRWNKIGATCSAGIDFIHIWPDGSVTACPYDSEHDPPKEDSTLLERIREAVLGARGENHPFHRCRIKECL